MAVLTGDNWTPVSNLNDLEVTEHYLSENGKLHMCSDHNENRREALYAEACAEHFMDVAKQRDIEKKTTTFSTDSARNMVAAAF